MDFKQYQEQANRTIPKGYPANAGFVNFGLGLAGEAGEVIEIIKKGAFHGKDVNLDDFRKELGDVIWYISALCTTVGLELEDVATHNIEKLKARHPQGFDPSYHKEQDKNE